MAEKLENMKADRRGFLKVAGMGAVASGAALISGNANAAEDKAAQAQGKQSGDDPKNGAGYQETEHVNTYYKSARF